MKRQLGMNLATEEERVASVLEYLRPVGLASRQIAAVGLIVGCGELIQVSGTAAARWQVAKEDVAEKAGKYGLKCSPNTFLRAVEELESRRLVGVLRTTRPWTYVVPLAALGQLETATEDPAEALAALPCFHPPARGDRTESQSVSVSVSQSARDRDSIQIQNPCPLREPCRATGDGGLADRLRRPWDRHAGIRDQDLIRAVRSGELEPIRALWREAKVLEWIGGSDDDLCRFLTIVNHTATSSGLNQSRMGALVARVKRGLDVSKIPHVSEEWAACVMRSRHRAQDAELERAGR